MSGASGKRFAAHELVPHTGMAAVGTDEAADDRVAAALGAFNAIRVGNAHHRRLVSYLGRVTAIGLAQRGGRQMGGRSLAPTGTGKTTSAETFREEYLAKGLHAEEENPVLIVPLDEACTSRRLFAAILRKLGDPMCDKGSEDVLRARASMALRRLGCRLLVIDEVQHLKSRSSERNDIADVIKRFLDDGIVPLVMLGTDDATSFLNSNQQLSMRLHAPGDLAPLNKSSKDDRHLFRDYVRDMDAAFVRNGVTRTFSDLGDRRTLSCLFEISGGVLGRVTNLLRQAVMIASGRDADRIEPCDLSAATRTWAIAQELIDYDPFTIGVRPAKASAK